MARRTVAWAALLGLAGAGLSFTAVQEPGHEAAAGGEEFAANAFPPTLSDTEPHADAWREDGCLRCHETGVGDAPLVVHRDLPPLLLEVKCRTCHVLIPGSRPRERAAAAAAEPFAPNAFPPMMPASAVHDRAWLRDDCLLCHEDGTHGAPLVRHQDLPSLYLEAKCRSCHVQVRAVAAARPEAAE